MAFSGLIYTDSMGMQGVTNMLKPGEAAVRAVIAGNDVVLHSPDDGAAFAAIKEAVTAGRIPMAQLDASVERIVRAKAAAGLHKAKVVNLDAIANVLGTRANQAVADAVSQQSITLIKDAKNQVPLRLPREAQILYLSMLDYPSGWQIAAPSRTFIPS
jgi:beta-N-acetylhexosaminidase